MIFWTYFWRFRGPGKLKDQEAAEWWGCHSFIVLGDLPLSKKKVQRLLRQMELNDMKRNLQ